MCYKDLCRCYRTVHGSDSVTVNRSARNKSLDPWNYVKLRIGAREDPCLTFKREGLKCAGKVKLEDEILRMTC